MSKKFLYNGSIKWYINYEKKENKIPIPSLLTRKYIKEEGYYKIVLSKDENIEVSKKEFIEKLKKYKNKKEDKDRNRINENKVFFELKEGQKTRKNTIICQSEELGKFSQKQGNEDYISRAKIEEFIEKEKLNIKDKGSIIYKGEKTRETEIITYIKKEESGFEKTKEEKSILVEILNDETIKERNCILKKMLHCNKELYEVMKIALNIDEKKLNSFSWKENIRNIIDSKIEGKTIEAINEVFSSSEKDFAISNMKISMNEEKLIFLNKLLKDKNIKVNKEMIVEYLYNILLSKNILKRVDKIYKKNDKDADDYFMRTYIENDIHTKNKDRLKETIKYYLDNENKLEEDIKEILNEYSYKEIFNSIYTTIKNEEISFSESRKLLGKYKEEYTKYNPELKDIIGSENREKELAKTIYRYGKGRIKKIALNKNLFEKIKIEKEGIDFYYDSFKDKKILKAIKSKFLEEILFTGKKEHENLDGNVVDFQRRHAYDELFNEYLALISNVNFEVGKLSGEEDVDISTPEDRKKIIEGIKKSEKNIPEEIKANEYKLFKHYLEETGRVRNKIIHGKIDDILSKSNELEEHEENFKELAALLNNRKISDEDISKNISASLVFQDKDKISKIEDINNYIEKLKLEEVNDKINNLYGIMPSYSKIVSKISKNIKFSGNINLKDKDIISNAVVYVFKQYYNYLINNEEYILSLGKDILDLDKDKDKKKGLCIDENNIDDICNEITNYYRRVQRTSSKGNPKPFRNFQKTLIDFFIKFIKYDYNKKNYDILFDFKNVSELNKIEGNKENNIVIKSIKENITIDNQLEYITLYSAILVDPIVSNMIRNRFNATVQWLKNMDLTYDNTKKHINLFENIYKKLSIVKTYTDDRELSELEKMSKAKIKQNEEEKDKLNEKTKCTKENVRRLIEGIKEYIKSICVKYDEPEEYKIGVDKDFLDKYKEIFNIDNDIFIEGKVLKSFKVEFKNKVLVNKELAFEKTLKDKLKEIKNKMEEYEKEQKDKEQKYVAIDENYSNKILGECKNLNFSNEEIKEKFLQGSEGNEIAVFQKHRYLAINRPIFKEIFDKFLKEYLEKIDKEELIEYDYVSFSKVDNFLNKFNLNMKNKSKRFKESEVERLKNNDEYFEKNYKEINSSEGFKSYGEFEKEYKNKGKYMLQENLLNFELVNKIYRHIVMINYKLQIHISRFERDCHYFVRGINDIFKDVKFYEDEFDKERSVAYKEDKNHYKWIIDGNMYEKIKKYFKFFNFNIPKKGEGEEEIRNYIAHFYMLRKPFDSSIIEKVEEMNNFMEYRSKYQNAVLKSVFEIFKKDCDIEYSVLDKKQKKLNKEFLDNVLKKKKITDFKLDFYFKCYPEFLKEVLLYKKTDNDNKSTK